MLLIGAHPDDEDTFLISWLSRGRHVQTAYLSLTRGDGGQNLIGNELGEALGVIRTEELLAARRIDGALQYFTRAYDFGFSKDTVDTYNHWPKDSILGDVVRVVRAFRPHVIVAVFSGTPRDGHGHHQVSGILAREAYDVASDTGRFPIDKFGTSWTPLKFYRAARFNQQAGTLSFDVGEYSPLLGRSYAEIAGESRSQHKSQGFGALQRKGPLLNYLRREASRVNEQSPAASEKTLFDGLDTTWARFRSTVSDARARAALDSLHSAFAAVRVAFDPFAPEKLIAPLSRAALWVRSICPPNTVNACERVERSEGGSRRTVLHADLAASVDNARIRILNALRIGSGISIEATSLEVLPLDTIIPILVSIYNRGRDTVAVSGGMASGHRGTSISMTRLLPPAEVLRDTLIGRVDSILQPWWLAGGKGTGMFVLPGSATAENRLAVYPGVSYGVDLGGRSMAETISLVAPVVFRYADDVRGEVQHPVSSAPFVTVALDQQNQYAQSSAPLDREIAVRLRSADPNPRVVRVTLALPRGLTADSATRTTRLGGYDARQVVAFRVRGRLPAGDHRIAAFAESNGATFRTGYQLIDYDHIRRQRIYRPAEIRVSAVDVRVPAALRVGYIAGVSDNVAPALAQLGIPVTVIPASDLARTPLSGFTTVVVGPRAYEAHPELVAANPRLLDFARKGGTLVVQYGQYEMMQPGIMPFPVTIARPHHRVTHEDAPVTILDPNAREMTLPNRIGDRDFAGWVQERALYMPRTFDERYRALLAMSDPGESANRGAILVAPLGEGVYIYTTLSFFRQLPAGVPGGARLFVNLLSAGIDPPRLTP
ncbi:MAG: PIG-L family deacetylase [Gemmatimonadaceae bacterium]